jgi:signal transduction histidine kinase
MTTQPSASEPATAPPSPGSAASAAPLYAAAAGLLALVYFGAVLVSFGEPGPALRATVLAGVPGAVFGFLVLRLGRRARWFDGSRRRLTGLHLALCAGYSAIWSVTVVVLLAAERALFTGNGFRIQLAAFGWTSFTGVLLYACVAGAAFGLETTTRLRDERARLARAEALRARAELAALRAQLNPHFLFNTLHTVLGLVRRDPALAEEALQDLGDVLRYALDVQRGGDHVALRDELLFVERYLAIERVRLGERLRVERSISEAALDCRLPAFTVQPIVENAIRYAVASRAQGGRVRIEARCDDGSQRLCVVVSDDGAAAPAPDGGSGLGLTLVRQRLEAAFGPSAQLVASRDVDGFVVTVHVPQPGAGAA